MKIVMPGTRHVRYVVSPANPPISRVNFPLTSPQGRNQPDFGLKHHQSPATVGPGPVSRRRRLGSSQPPHCTQRFSEAQPSWSNSKFRPFTSFAPPSLAFSDLTGSPPPGRSQYVTPPSNPAFRARTIASYSDRHFPPQTESLNDNATDRYRCCWICWEHTTFPCCGMDYSSREQKPL